MAYLDPSEYTTYCGDVDVTDFDVAYASGLIDAIIGKTLEPSEDTYLVKLRGDKGKLRYAPVIEVLDIKGVNVSSAGVTESSMPISSIYVTDDYGRFQYFSTGINSMVWGTPSNLKVKYKYGYNEIPEDIKIVCGSIAKNIVRIDSIGGISGAKSISSLDFNISMFDDRLFSSNELLILQKYKGV